jgi:hypothetical protein
MLWLEAICTMHAAAAPLDAEDCEKLQQEHVELTKTGVKQDMAKGPDWAAANLARDRLDRIQRMIEVEEQVAFRCPQPKPAKAAAKEKPPAPKAQSAGRTKAEPGDEAVPLPAKSPVAKAARPKVDDAYVPPPKSQELPWSDEHAR